MQVFHILAAVISTKMSGHPASHLRWTLILFVLVGLACYWGAAR